MEDQIITSTTEPTIVESANTSAENTAGLSQVIDQATPMDSNTTYSNLPKVEYQPNMSPTQNLINEAVQTEHAINQESNAGKAMNSFLTQGYDYDKNEAGTYWVAGAINDNNTQMSFLETLINEEMYDEMDLQKYYYDTNLATARAYAAQKGKETAYGFYRAAQERALAEGELTGWYMPAEGRYLLGQYTVAQNTLENPDATPEEISKANRVAKAAESWFSANQITTRGIKCLAMMNYEENVRHNTVMGELQKQANDIARQGAAASAASAKLQLRELKFQVEEMELQSGYDYSNAIGLDDDNYLGHKREDYQGLQALKGYNSTAEMLENDPSSYAAVLGATSKEWVDKVLGDKAKPTYKKYKNDQHLASFKSEINGDVGKITEKSGGFDTVGKTKDGKEIKVTVVGNKAVAGYFEDNVWVPITDENAKLANGKTIKSWIENAYGAGSMDTTGINAIEIDGEVYSFGRSNTSTDETSYTNLSGLGYKKLVSENWGFIDHEKTNKAIEESYTTKGTKDKDGKTIRNLTYRQDLMDEKNENEYTIFSGEDADGNESYYKVNTDGSFEKIDKVVEVNPDDYHFKVGDSFQTTDDLFSGDNKKERLAKASWVIGESKDGKGTYVYVPTGADTYDIILVQGSFIDTQKTDHKVLKVGITDDELTKNNLKPVSQVTTSTTVTQNTNYNANNNTEKLDQKDIKISDQVNGNVNGSKGTTTYNPENTKATYTKQEVNTDGSPVLATLNEKEREDLQKNKINKVVI
jgi:hypothetical protein